MGSSSSASGVSGSSGAFACLGTFSSSSATQNRFDDEDDTVDYIATLLTRSNIVDRQLIQDDLLQEQEDEGNAYLDGDFIGRSSG